MTGCGVQHVHPVVQTRDVGKHHIDDNRSLTPTRSRTPTHITQRRSHVVVHRFAAPSTRWEVPGNHVSLCIGPHTWSVCLWSSTVQPQLSPTYMHAHSVHVHVRAQYSQLTTLCACACVHVFNPCIVQCPLKMARCCSRTKSRYQKCSANRPKASLRTYRMCQEHMQIECCI